MILENIIQKLGNEKLFSLLIDPDKYTSHSIVETLKIAESCQVDYILVGGSLVSNSIDSTIRIIKENSNIPVVLFPGSYLQISDKADGILFISLISGRNPEYLIGNHVVVAPFLKKTNLEIIPTGYILIYGKRITSVEYMSNTIPIPPEKLDIITPTAQAGELLGLKLLYLEAGSGSTDPISQNAISTVKNNTNIPLIVGGGLNTPENILQALDGGADMVVVGNSAENNLSQMAKLCETTKNYYK